MNQIRKTIFAFLTFFFCCTTVFASTKTGYVDATLGLIVRENAGTSYKKIETLSNKTVVTIKDTKNTADSSTGCPNNVWYYMNKSGIMQTGWIDVDQKRYYMDQDGIMQTGTINVDGETYELQTDGSLKK